MRSLPQSSIATKPLLRSRQSVCVILITDFNSSSCRHPQACLERLCETRPNKRGIMRRSTMFFLPGTPLSLNYPAPAPRCPIGWCRIYTPHMCRAVSPPATLTVTTPKASVPRQNFVPFYQRVHIGKRNVDVGTFVPLSARRSRIFSPPPRSARCLIAKLFRAECAAPCR